jgi:hypothetical protein
MASALSLPDTLTLHHLLQFARRLDALPQSDLLTFDMGRGRHFPPFPMLFLVAKILEYRERYPATVIKLLNQDDHSYAAHMGFFRAAGFSIGNEPGEARGNARYLPIRVLTRDELHIDEADRYAELGDLIQRHADDIAELMSRDSERKTELFDILSYSLREMIRNVFEHSHSDRAFYCGQYWPTKGKVEVCLLDRGIGIRQSLQQNPNFRFRTDKEAVEMCLWPGVSGKTHLTPTSTNWANSGYGLYMTSRLARHGGNFTIASGDACVMLSKSMQKENFSTHLQGTAVRMNLDVYEIGNVSARLQQFRKEAQDISKRFTGIRSHNPSYMSMVLRRDFREDGLRDKPIRR